jgi:hypothetical protein
MSAKSKAMRQREVRAETKWEHRWHSIRPWVRRLVEFSLGAATLLGIVVLPPRISVEKPSESVDAFHPFELPFALSNDGYFSIYKVKINCIPDHLVFQFHKETGAPADTDNKAPTTTLKNQAFEQIPILSAGDRRSFVCDVFHFNQPPESTGAHWPVQFCNVGIGITFRPIRFIHWRVFRQFSFQASISSDGKLRWAYPILEQKQATYPPSY